MNCTLDASLVEKVHVPSAVRVASSLLLIFLNRFDNEFNCGGMHTTSFY